MAETPKSTHSRVVLVGIGGGSCSGKTTLAKALQSILPDCVLLHQDDFAPPPECIPTHPIHKVADWENPETAIDWSKLVRYLQDVKKYGAPAAHVKHDGWVEGATSIQLSSTTLNAWKLDFDELASELTTQDANITWVIIEGFVLYWHPDVVSELDIRLFLRGEYGSMKSRRESRGGYQAPDGYTWSDPPNYWDNIVWPAYLKSHQYLFVDGDINGTAAQPGSDTKHVRPKSEDDTTDRQPVAGLIVLSAGDTTLDDLVRVSCEEIKAFQTALIERATELEPEQNQVYVDS